MSFSPGLHVTCYPGTRPNQTTQPQRGCAFFAVVPILAVGTALRFDLWGTHSQGRPSWIRPTLGWRTQSRWDKNLDASTVSMIFMCLISLRQRRYVLQPRVARYVLPWDSSQPDDPTATRLRPVRRRANSRRRNRVAVRSLRRAFPG